MATSARGLAKKQSPNSLNDDCKPRRNRLDIHSTFIVQHSTLPQVVVARLANCIVFDFALGSEYL